MTDGQNLMAEGSVPGRPPGGVFGGSMTAAGAGLLASSQERGGCARCSCRRSGPWSGAALP
jgi:hypothetical protein